MQWFWCDKDENRNTQIYGLFSLFVYFINKELSYAFTTETHEQQLPMLAPRIFG